MEQVNEMQVSPMQAFEQLLIEHMGYLKKLALRLTRDTHEGDDLLQDVLLKLFERRTQVLSISDVRPWMARVIRHQFIDRYRQMRRDDRLFVRSDVNPNDGEDAATSGYGLSVAHEMTASIERSEEGEVCDEVRHAMQKLTGRQRDMVQLHELDGYSLHEIAIRYEMPLYTVKSLLARGRVALRNILAEDDPALASLVHGRRQSRGVRKVVSTHNGAGRRQRNPDSVGTRIRTHGGPGLPLC